MKAAAALGLLAAAALGPGPAWAQETAKPAAKTSAPAATASAAAAKKAHRKPNPEQIRRFNELQKRQDGKR